VIFWVLSSTHQICFGVSKTIQTDDEASEDSKTIEKDLIRPRLFLARDKFVTVDTTTTAAYIGYSAFSNDLLEYFHRHPLVLSKNPVAGWSYWLACRAHGPESVGSTMSDILASRIKHKQEFGIRDN
jgi:hypothetical protein